MSTRTITGTTPLLLNAPELMRSIEWLLHFAKPGRPLPRELERWSKAMKEASKNRSTDPAKATKLAQLRSLLAARLVQHLSVITAPPTAGDRAAAECQVAPGARLDQVVLVLLDDAGLLPSEMCIATLQMVARGAFHDHYGGAEPAYAALSRAVACHHASPDASLTENDIKRERVDHLHSLSPGLTARVRRHHTKAKSSSATTMPIGPASPAMAMTNSARTSVPPVVTPGPSGPGASRNAPGSGLATASMPAKAAGEP